MCNVACSIIKLDNILEIKLYSYCVRMVVPGTARTVLLSHVDELLSTTVENKDFGDNIVE